MRQGVLLLIIAMFLTPGLDGIAKHLSLEYSPFFVCFLRYFSAGIVALFASKIIGQPIYVPKQGRLGQVVRTALLIGAMTCLITALSMVPMAHAVGGFLIAPLVATLLSVIFFKEALTTQRVIGALLSLGGALVISKPAASVEMGTLIALFGGALLGSYLAATRGTTASGGAFSSLAVQCLLGSLLLAPLAFANGPPPLDWSLLYSVLFLGVLSAIAHSLTVAAFERADASVLSPFLYFNLIAAIAVGYLWFNEVPSGWSMFGLLLIAGGGLVTIMPHHAFNSYVRAWVLGFRKYSE